MVPQYNSVLESKMDLKIAELGIEWMARIIWMPENEQLCDQYRMWRVHIIYIYTVNSKFTRSRHN